MRVVVDTTTFVSAALKHGSLPYIALRDVSQRHVLLTSAATEAQLLAVITRPYLARLIADDMRAWLMRLMGGAELVPITETVVACRDATDDKFLELAVCGDADPIVSGDRDLLVLNRVSRYPDCRAGNVYAGRRWINRKGSHSMPVITVPADMKRLIRDKIAQGAVATEGEFVAAAVR